MYYHFAFLIPESTLFETTSFLQDLDIPILNPFENNIIDFGNGKSVYFHDANNNILEFIDRPSLEFVK